MLGKTKWLMAVSLVAMAAVAGPAEAKSKMPTNTELLDRIEALEAELAKQKKSNASTSAKVAKIEEGQDFEVKWEPAPAIKSKDGRFEMNLRGRLYVDYGIVSDTDGTGEGAGADRTTNTTEIRTARIGIEGKAWKDVKYKFEADFQEDIVEMKDAYLAWGSPIGNITVGQFKTPNSLDEQTSSRHIAFVERGSFTDAFELARMVGVGLDWDGKFGDTEWTLATGAYKGSFAQDADDNADTAYAARATVAPKLGDALVHLGASVRHRDVGDSDAPAFRYRQRPHSHLAASRYVDTGSAAARLADSDLFYGAEAALIWGPLTVSGEYAWLEVLSGGATIEAAKPSFDGGYVDVMYFLTGEKRGYKGGAFDRPKVNNPVFDGGWGAWAVGYRFDYIDLSDELIQGGEQTTNIFGVNWYLNRHTRMMFNYNHSNVHGARHGGSNNGDGSNEINAYTIRAQVDW